MSTAIIFETGLARNTDPETSHLAAASVNATKLEQLVLDCVRESTTTGMTAMEVTDELSSVLGPWGIRTISPRFAPLVRKGMLIPSGKRRGESGRLQLVYRLPEFCEQSNV